MGSGKPHTLGTARFVVTPSHLCRTDPGKKYHDPFKKFYPEEDP